MWMSGGCGRFGWSIVASLKNWETMSLTALSGSQGSGEGL